MTKPVRGVVVAVVVTVAVALAFLGRHQHLPADRAANTAPVEETSGTNASARLFVEAFVDLESEHPHGEWTTLRRLTTASLLRRLRTANALIHEQLQAGGITQTGEVTSVAIHRREDRATALVTTQLTDTTPGIPALRTAAAYTVTLQLTGGTWLVVGVTA